MNTTYEMTPRIDAGHDRHAPFLRFQEPDGGGDVQERAMGSPSGFMRKMYAASRARQTTMVRTPWRSGHWMAGILPLEAPGLQGKPGAAGEDGIPEDGGEETGGKRPLHSDPDIRSRVHDEKAQQGEETAHYDIGLPDRLHEHLRRCRVFGNTRPSHRRAQDYLGLVINSTFKRSRRRRNNTPEIPSTATLQTPLYPSTIVPNRTPRHVCS